MEIVGFTTDLIWGKRAVEPDIIDFNWFCLSYRHWLNTTASVSIAIATVFDLAVWYYVKDLVIFDKKIKETASEEGDGEAEKKN